MRLWRTGVGGKGGAVLVCQVLVDARQPLLHRYFELLNACTVIVKHQHFTDRCVCVATVVVECTAAGLCTVVGGSVLTG